MSLKLLHLPFDHQCCRFDTSELDKLQQSQTVLSSQHLFFFSHTGPCLTLLLTLSPHSSEKHEARLRQKPTVSEFSERVAKSTRKTADLLAELPVDDQQLFKTLQNWRKERAQQDGVPPYVIFTNKELLAIVLNRPNTETAMQRIPGIGKKKSSRFARPILDILTAASKPVLVELEASDEC